MSVFFLSLTQVSFVFLTSTQISE